MEQLEKFYNSLPPELQEKIAMLEPEEQQQVLMELMQRQQNSQSEYAQMGANPQGQKVPVEAERNETLTVQDGEEPETEGGYLKEISRNPISGQATYEIPDNHHNATHDQGGVSMELKEGDVVNSDKTKIPTDFRVNNSNFKGKTFKDASDFISKKENELQKNFNDLAKKGKVDRVSEGSLSLMLAKLASSRNQLNELQEIVLSHKEKKEEGMKMGGSIYAESGTKVGERIPYILDFQMPNYQYDDLSKGKGSPKLPDNVKDRMVNTYHAPYPVIQAADGITASLQKVKDFNSRIKGAGNDQSSMQDIVSAFHQSGLGASSPVQNVPSLAGFFDTSGKSAKAINVNMPKEDILRTIVSESKNSGVDPAFMLAMGHIESRFNPNAISSTKATGLYQFTTDTGKQYGLLGDGFDNRKDPVANTKAAIALIKDNQRQLEKRGIPITPTMLYLAHQQGAGGAIEIYNAAMKGTPISKAVQGNMQVNFKTTDPQRYLTKTAQEVMSRVNAYLPKLANLDEKADYEAFNYKQKYSTNAPIQQIKQNISQYGMKGVLKRTKDGASLTEYAEQNPQEQQQEQPPMAYGGYINHGYNISIPGSEYMGGRKDYLMDGNYSQGGSVMPHGFNLSIPGPELMGRRKDYLMDGNYATGGYVTPHGYNISIPGPELMGRRRDYLMDGNYAYGGPVYAQEGKRIGSSSTGYTPVQNIAKNPQPFINIVGDDYNNWTQFMKEEVLDNINDPEVQQAVKKSSDVAKGYKTHKGDWLYWATDTLPGNAHEPFIPLFNKWKNKKTAQTTPLNYTGEMTGGGPFLYGYETPINISQLSPEEKELAKEHVDNEGNIVMGYDEKGEQYFKPFSTEAATTTTPSGDNASGDNKDKGPSWMDRIKYGLREAIPYLDNLRLLREGRIMPVLQQKPYQNPYDNLSTDYSIQSALNDIDRSTLTAMADERGNPSVRNARLAQIAANAIAGKAPLYTQKYNQEQQLKNAKTLGQYDYLNKWTDTNMALSKRYEQEVLQTIENQRQQQHMALNKMANDYLRSKENKQNLELATMNTNYVWNPYTERLEFDPVKAKENTTWLKEIINLKGSGTKSKSKKEDDETPSDNYKRIEKDGKVTFEKVTSKYGSTVKGRKKLSLKNYY